MDAGRGYSKLSNEAGVLAAKNNNLWNYLLFKSKDFLLELLKKKKENENKK